MTRQHAALMLLQHGALTFGQMVTITGWPVQVLRQTLHGLREAERVKHSGGYGGLYSV